MSVNSRSSNAGHLKCEMVGGGAMGIKCLAVQSETAFLFLEDKGLRSQDLIGLWTQAFNRNGNSYIAVIAKEIEIPIYYLT